MGSLSKELRWTSKAASADPSLGQWCANAEANPVTGKPLYLKETISTRKQ